MNPRRFTPSISLLIAFESAARHQSFTRAAEELALTQSAVSRQVQALEQLLGVALFRRTARQIALTDVGAMYLRELSAALGRIRNATLQVISYQSGGGSLHLAVLPTFGSKWLLPRLSAFYAQHPGILIHVHSRIGQFDLDLAGMDAVIHVGDGQWAGLVSHRLLDEELVPVISPAVLAEQPIKTPADLCRHLLLQVAARPDSWPKWFAAHQLPTSRMRTGPQFELTAHLLQAVAAGLGVGLVPRFLVQDELESGALVLALDLPMRSDLGYYLSYVPHKAALPPVAAFREWMLAMRAGA